MSYLDCDTFETTLETTAAILGVGSGQLLERVRRFDYGSVSERDRLIHPYEELLLMHAVGLTRSELPKPNLVYWFHATRVLPGTRFEQGILPQSAILESIWDFLGELAQEWTSPDEWQAFRRNMRGPAASRYRMKIDHQVNQGPFAFLVREAIFHPEMTGNHDYLAIPELVEDVCSAYYDMFGHPLRERFEARTSPCIVKFRSSDCDQSTIEPATMYLHHKATGKRLSLDCSTCYSGEGRLVIPEHIVRIEWPGTEKA